MASGNQKATMGAIAFITAAVVIFGLTSRKSEETPVPRPDTSVQYAAQSPAEDDPNFDCAKHGNHVCRIGDGLWLSLDHLPADPYERCLLLIDATTVPAEGTRLSASAICESIRGNR